MNNSENLNTCPICGSAYDEIFTTVLDSGYRVKVRRSSTFCSKDGRYICYDCCKNCTDYRDASGQLICQDRTEEEIAERVANRREREYNEELLRISAAYHESRRRKFAKRNAILRNRRKKA